MAIRAQFSLLLGLWIAALPAPEALAAQDLTLVRMARTAAMGGAGVGLADDENALFQNVAGLAGQEERRFRLVGASIEASLDTYETFGTSLSAMSNFNINSLNKLMGKDINFRGGETAMVLLPHFALAYLADAQGSINEYNLANPNFDFGYMITHGVQFGTAWKFSRGRRPTSEFRVGVAGKLLWRRGGYYNISTSGFLQATNSGKQYVDDLVGSYGMGFGADIGLQFINRVDKQTQVSAGFSVLDIAGTRFSEPKAMSQPMTFNLGVGMKKDLQFGKISLGADLRNFGRDTAFANKTHFGGELKMPGVDLYAGMNQLNYTYGLGFDLWVLKVTALSTAEEMGVATGQNTSRRYMLFFEFNMPI